MQQNPSTKTTKNPAKTQQNARFLDVFTHARARQCMVQKIRKGGNERGGEGKEEKEEEEEKEKEEDEEEDEEDEEEDKEDEEDEHDEEEEEDEAKRREEGRRGGGESVENLVRGDSFKAKAKAKPKQSKIHKTRRQAGGLSCFLKFRRWKTQSPSLKHFCMVRSPKVLFNSKPWSCTFTSSCIYFLRNPTAQLRTAWQVYQVRSPTGKSRAQQRTFGGRSSFPWLRLLALKRVTASCPKHFEAVVGCDHRRQTHRSSGRPWPMKWRCSCSWRRWTAIFWTTRWCIRYIIRS